MSIQTNFLVCLVYLCLSALIVYSKPTSQRVETEPKCGYESCPKTVPGKLNIHIVPHSHDDVGWLKTVDQYYYGSQTKTQRAGVQYILDSVVQELLRNPDRRFVYVESAFFFKWWEEQTEDVKEQVKELVNEGRLEFLGGAWSMNDEATTHYQSIIDQFTLGLRFLNDTFGECARPRVGWQIDPFGHSREMASLFAQMGFDGMFFARLDYEEKSERLTNKTAEMIWEGSDSLGSSSDLFTGVLYNHYSSPPGFCFDVLCSDEPIIDGKHSPDNNVDRRLESLLQYLQKMAQYYQTNHLMVPFGDDFHYQDAHLVYKNLDKLIKYANERQPTESDVHLFYSSPSCYLKSLSEVETTWPRKTHDFFPYDSDPTAFWTGYFTSRPDLKYFERKGNHFLQVCKQLTATALRDENPSTTSPLMSRLQLLQDAMGIMQHHDAITGTEKAAVASDYARLLNEGMVACEENAENVLNKQVQKKGGQLAKFDFESCLHLNISSCEVSEKSSKFMVTVYNVLSQETDQYVRVPIQDVNYIVRDPEGNLIQSQIVPIPVSVREIHNRFSVALKELVFLAKAVPANGYRSYFIEVDPNDVSSTIPEVVLIRKPREPSKQTVIRSGELDLTFDGKGKLASITLNGVTKNVKHDFFYYPGAAGNNQGYDNRSSGAYIFRPNGTAKAVAEDVDLQLVQGPLVDEVHQKFNDWISQVIRVYKGTNYVEFEWLVGPIPVDDNIGKEVVSRFSSELKTNGVFYTDSNGRQTLKRVRNQRPDYTFHLREEVSGNYYPITTKIALEDKETRLAVLIDRAQGGSSLEDGAIELMVNRRLLHDDGFGVGEALNVEQFGRGAVARGKHFLIFGPSNSDIRMQERQLQLQTTLPLWVFFSGLEDSVTFEDWKDAFVQEKSLWPIQLPQNIHMMTLEPLGANKLLLRFEHILEKTDDPITQAASSSSAAPSQSVIGHNPSPVPGPVHSSTSNMASGTTSTINTLGVGPITFDISDFLKSNGDYTYSIRRTTLGGNLWYDDMKRLHFNKDTNGDELLSGTGNGNDDGDLVRKNSRSGDATNAFYEDSEAVNTKITLEPMEIVTLIVERSDAS
ncbi:unnamed protein product [Hermetia illucens]|uniref:Alpha-mannosidase n=1 Tax=Hermetia illucens TaxID=343691 RepID=A0A7R8USG3_HERIL|nr:lysosomal alpha-mannosidase-like [Hermetia illucens]CAD7086199.1 unnamed protein product [Hermetia illucens]